MGDLPEIGAKPQFASFAELREAARRTLEPAAWDYLVSGSGDEETARENEEAFADWRFLPRALTGIDRPDLRCELLGVQLSLPVLTAPFGVDGLFHPEGQKAVLRADQMFGTAGIVPEHGTFPLEELRGLAPDAAQFFQLRPSTPEVVAALARRAENAGYRGLFVTVDQPVLGIRERNLANGFIVDPALVSGNIDPATTPDDAFSGLYGPPRYTWDWNILAAVLKETSLPFGVKGVLTAETARQAIAAGASAIVVSNHGGRQLHSAPATLRQLPEVADAVGGRVPVLLDGGIRRGSDVVKALALGADAVLIGRAAAFGLAAAGSTGVLSTLELLAHEIETVLCLLGVGSPAELDPRFLRPART